MTVRFFMLQSHYSSTLDFSNEALMAAEKGYKKLNNALGYIKNLTHPGKPGQRNNDVENELNRLVSECHLNMSDDFNTAKTLAVLFEMASRINDIKSGNIKLDTLQIEIFNSLKNSYTGVMEEVLGLKEEQDHDHQLLDGVINVLINLRKKAREDRNFALSDKIRDDLKALGIQLMDGKDGAIDYALE